MTTQEIEEALAALPPSDAIAQDMRECGYREEVIRAVVVAIDHARPLLWLAMSIQRVSCYPQSAIRSVRSVKSALLAVKRVRRPVR